MSDADPGRDNEARSSRRIWALFLALGIGVPAVGAWAYTVDIPEGCVADQPAKVTLDVSSGEPDFDVMAHSVIGAGPDHYGDAAQYLKDWNRKRDDGGMRTAEDVRQGNFYLYKEIFCADEGADE